MVPSEERRRWLEIGLFTGAAFLLYQVRAAFFLSAVPLFLLGYRRDRYAQLYGAGLFLAAVFLQIAVHLRALDDPQLVRFFTVIEVAYPLSFVLGILWIQWRGGRTLYAMLEASILVGALSVPVIIIFSGNQEITGFLADQIRAISESIRQAFGQGVEGGGAASAPVIAGDEMVKLVKDLFFRNYLFSYFLLLSATWAISEGINRRMTGVAPFTLERFTVPEKFLWPLIGVWAGVLLDVIGNLGFFGYLVWNAGMILLFVYALQGIGILRYLFRRHGVGPGLRILVIVASVIVLFTPGINLVLIIGIPLLGVSEYWIHYRIGEGEQL